MVISRYISSKFSGSTFIEMISAMAILSLTFTLSMNLFSMLVGIDSPVKRFQTQGIVHTFLLEPIQAPYEEETERMILGRRCIRTITPIEKSSFTHIKVSCFQNDRLLLERERIAELILTEDGE